MAKSELPTITFNLQPDVGITFTTPWMSESDPPEGKPWDFSISCPAEVIEFIDRHAGGKDTMGVHSPPNKLTIMDPKLRKSAGIPLQCSYYCFCYPLECLLESSTRSSR